MGAFFPFKVEMAALDYMYKRTVVSLTIKGEH
jgi:hypothetical protein